jgi:ribose transport system permease protein
VLNWLIHQFGVVGPLPVLLVGLIIFFCIAEPIFLSPQNLSDLGVQSVFLLFMASGQMIVLVTGGFDMSVSATVAFVSIVSATVMRDTWLAQVEQAGSIAAADALGPVLLSLVVAIAIGCLIGLANGLGVALLKINAFIVTLAVATILGGLMLIYSGGLEVTGLPALYKDELGSGRLAGIPWLIILTIPVLAVLYLMMHNTTFGLHLYALGDNPTSARIAGIKVGSKMVLAYVIASVLVAIAAWLLTARVGAGHPGMGGSYTMQSITAAVIGGVSLRGGRGGVLGTVLGVLFIQVLANGMNLMRLDTNTQSIAVGAALILAVLIDRLRDRARAHSAVVRRLQLQSQLSG